MFIIYKRVPSDDLFKEKAIEIGDRLLPAITASKSSVPYSDVNLKKRQAHSPRWGSSSSTSEVTTIQMEFRILYNFIFRKSYSGIEMIIICIR